MASNNGLSCFGANKALTDGKRYHLAVSVNQVANR
jgi:hypothetical protein